MLYININIFSSRSCGKFSAVLYYNNMACIHLAMGKPNLACFYLQKALQENKNAVESVQIKDTGKYSNLYHITFF